MPEKREPNPYDFARNLLDLQESMETTEEQNLTWEELASILGVRPNAKGNLDSVELINACMHVQGNEAISALPKAERLRVIRGAAGALDHLMGSRGQ